MKRNFLTLVLALLLSMLVIVAIAQNDTWTAKEDFSGGIRSAGVSFAIGTKIYAGTGIDESPAMLDDIWEYDITNDSWTQKGDFDGGTRFAGVGFTINGKGYIAFGADIVGSFQNDIWEYNPANDTWTKKADFPDGGRVGQFVFIVDNKAYIGAGQNASGDKMNDLWVFDPAANTWTQKASLPAVGRMYATAFAIGTKGYVGTGADVNEEGLADFWEYNTANDQWTRKADHPNATLGAIGFSTATRGYLGLGATNELYSYYPGENVWVKEANFTAGFLYLNGTVARIGNKAYVGLGVGTNTAGYFEYALGTDQTITFNALATKTYGDPTFGLTATSTSGLTVSFTSSNTSVATIAGTTVTIVGAGTTTIKALQAGNGTYDAALPVERTLTVNKANQTITFNTLAGRNANEGPFVLTGTASSTLSVSYVSSNTSVATIDGHTVTIVGSGTTTITASQAGNTHYNAATSIDRDLVVSKVNQTITFAALSAKNVGDAAFGLTAAASSTLPVSYVSSNTSVATINGSTVTIVGGGTTTITASQPGNSIYNAATSVDRDLVVTKGAQTWVGTLPTTGGYGNDITLTLHLSSNLNYTLTSSNESVATVSFNGTNFIISPKTLGTTTLTASHPGNAGFDPAPTITADLVISKGTQTITFDEIPGLKFAQGNLLIVATATTGLPVTFDQLPINSGLQIYGNVGMAFGTFDGDITAHVDGNDYYLPATQTKHVTITASDATLTMQPIPEKSVGDAPFKPSMTGGMSYSLTSSNTAVATIVNQQVVIKAKGTTTIQASSTDIRFAPSTASQELVVKEASTITFSELATKTVGDAPFTVQATSSAGLPITYTTGDPAVATVEGNTVTIKGAGSTSIIASVGDNNYTAVAASQLLVVKGPTQTPEQQGQFWGVMQNGGNDLRGNIFKTNADGTGLRVVKSFSGKDGFGSGGYLSTVIAPNGKIYSSTSQGGKNGHGVFFEYDPGTGTISKIFDYEYSEYPLRTMRITADGKLFGVRGADLGGELRPVLFEMDLATKTISNKKSLNTILNDVSDLIITHDKKIYAIGIQSTTEFKRIVVEYVPSSGAVTKRAEMSIPSGSYWQTGPVEISNGKIYGVNTNGGANSQGLIFEFDPAANTFIGKADLPAFTGVTNSKGLMKTSAGRIFGVASSGGANSSGYIYEYDPVQNVITKRADFPLYTGGPTGELAEGTNGKLYGSDNAGNAGGGLFEFNPTTFELREIFIFTDNTGRGVNGNLAVAGNKLYGISQRGGNNNGGVLFDFDYTTRTLSKKYEFGEGPDGDTPVQGMVLHSNGKFYGVTKNGGANGDGTIFELDPVTEEYKAVFNFNRNTVGSNPWGAVIVGQNGKLYGTTRWADRGPYTAGSFFEFDVQSKTYTSIVAQTPADGNGVTHQLAQARNGRLYALTVSGGVNQRGSLVEVDVASRSYRKLADLTDFRGYYPYGPPLVASNGKIYGTTSEGGENGKGTLFEYDLQTATFTVKHDFDVATGSNPGTALLEIDGQLWGLASTGGKVSGGGVGVLFTYDLATGAYTVKADLENIGSGPGGKILQAANGKLYFMTTNGGRTANGVLAEYDIVANKITSKSEFPMDINIDRLLAFLTQGPKSSKKDQTITFSPIEAKVIGAEPFSLTATATSGLAVVVTTGNDKITYDASTNKVKPVLPGKAVLKGNQPGDASYNPAAEAQITFCINPLKPEIRYTGANDGSSTLTSTAGAGNQWYKDGTAIAGATGVTYNVTVPGIYTVIASVDGCSSETSQAFPIIVTGDLEAGSKDFSIYPNPVDDRVYIVLPGANRKRIAFIQTDGRIAEEHETSSSVLEVDVRHYAAGLYLVRISDENGTHPTLKFIRK